MDKLTMATKVLLKLIETDKTGFDAEGIAAYSFEIADAMQAEADKRKPKGLPDALREEWQPDWSQAPVEFNWFFKQQDGSCHFSDSEPEFLGDAWAIEADSYLFESPISCPVDWEDSLRERPHGF